MRDIPSGSDMDATYILHFLLVWLSLEGLTAGPTMGPADINLKFMDKCKFRLPTFIDLNFRLYQKRGKPTFSLNGTIPFKFSDKIGFAMNIEVKRNGVWKPNFFKADGQNLCSGLKIAQYKVFVLFAKSLEAPEPYTCPLPAGRMVITDFTPDMTAMQSGMIGNVLPYGELRINVNITHKNDVISCTIHYADIMPKKSKRRG